jgi:adenine-specific DNA-methyltransferase
LIAEKIIGKDYKEILNQYIFKPLNMRDTYFGESIDKKALVNWKRFTKDSKKDGKVVKEIKRDKSGLIQENLIIKGNNLLALHSLKSEFVKKIS